MNQRQLYETLRQDILQGKYPAGTRLPASRVLSAELGTSRMTLQAAVKQLVAEGLLITKRGSGVYVSEAMTLDEGSGPLREIPFSEWGDRLLNAPLLKRKGARGSQLRSFATSFPYDTWRRLLNRYLSTDDAILSRYGSPAGFVPLRQAIAGEVARLRGINCKPEEVIIVNGIQQALDILARLLLDLGEEVVVEDPGYVSAYRVFSVYGAELQPVRVDHDGLLVDEIPDDTAARLAFVTPANQFPVGGALSLERRMALLSWARRQQAMIIEDDYDGELRYDGQPLASLQSLDRDGRVIYLGTFSKVLFPALRLGYVVLPQALHGPFLRAKQLLDRGAPTLTQAAVADFISEGHFERHLKRLRQLYGRRQELVIQSLNANLEDKAHVANEPAGLHVWINTHRRVDESALMKKIGDLGLPINLGSRFYLSIPNSTTLLFNFSELDELEIEKASKLLASSLLESMF